MALTEEHHLFRSKGIGSSDAPVIAGLSQWKTIQELWHEKIFGKTHDDNWAMARGRALEPIARCLYEETYDVSVPAKNFVHRDYSFMLASLDGWNENGKFLIEIKAPGKEDLRLAKDGRVPSKYYPQIQHQLFVTQARYADYVTYDGYGEIFVSRVWPDSKFQRKMFLLSRWFWQKVLARSEITKYEIKLQVPEVPKAKGRRV